VAARTFPEAPDLRVANLRVEIAVHIVALIDDMVEDADERHLVIADMVDCWLHLDPTVQTGYEDDQHESGPAAFAADYAAAVDRIWLDQVTEEPFTMHDTVTDDLCRAGWRKHIQLIRSRMDRAAPPDLTWLRHIPPGAS
jgi:hypothetical protein